MRNVGVISVSSDYLVRVVGYKGGKLISVSKDDEHGFNMVRLVIEHETLPETFDGDYVGVVEEVKLR